MELVAYARGMDPFSSYSYNLYLGPNGTSKKIISLKYEDRQVQSVFPMWPELSLS